MRAESLSHPLPLSIPLFQPRRSAATARAPPSPSPPTTSTHSTDQTLGRRAFFLQRRTRGPRCRGPLAMLQLSTCGQQPPPLLYLSSAVFRLIAVVRCAAVSVPFQRGPL